MTGQINIAPQESAPLLGDPNSLLAQLGSPGDLVVPALATTAMQFEQVCSLPALKSFLERYQDEMLVPLELPMIKRAYLHASRNELRELVALDEALAGDLKLKVFAAASCRVGQRQLNRLRPMRDHRFVQRYLGEIEAGRARGWHTLVFGVTLATFALPLRSGLVNYGRQTLGGFIESAAKPLTLNNDQRVELHSEVCACLPAKVAALLEHAGLTGLKLI